jgi:ABC-type transporter lipoprotein component MlaA
MKTFLLNFQIVAVAALAAMHSASLLAQAAKPNDPADKLQAGQMPYFDSVPDPLEGFNRCSWAVNNWLLRGVIYPLSFGYNTVAPKPVRKCITQAGHNLTFPARAFNSCLQGKWKGAWEETKRFGVNSTVGLGGFFDPATHWKIGRSEEDFGLTLGRWGSKPWFYLMIPIMGPSNGRDAVGKMVDTPFDIAFMLGCAYPDKLWPDLIRPGFMVNDLSSEARNYKRQIDSLEDPYQGLRTLYSLNRQRQVLEFKPSYEGDFHPDPSIGAILFKPFDEDFADKAVTRKVWVPATGKKLAYSCWMQKKPAPLVCYLPGLGSYRLDRSSVAYADMLYRHGYSVVAMSNPFHKDFMASASTMAVPGYSPVDCDDVVRALGLIVGDVRKWKGRKITQTWLTGVSDGAYFTLMIAAREAAGKLGGLTFDRYVAVNPPPGLDHAEEALDKMFDIPLKWPAAERRARMDEAIYKALYFADSGLDISGKIPMTRDESDFLIGLMFRYTLMSFIEESQRRHNLGVLHQDPDKFVRQDSYREIEQIDYAEYTDRFLLPYLIQRGLVTNRQELVAATSLIPSTELLRNNPKIRVQICEDDFLLRPDDIAWFRSTFGSNLKSYEIGGHLGNLYVPAVQEGLVRLFSDEAAK